MSGGYIPGGMPLSPVRPPAPEPDWARDLADKLTPFADEVRAETDAVAELLIQKNAAYGDSALNPLRCFSKADLVEQIKVRIDDKLSRLARGSADGEDVEKDLMGYLVLLRIARKREAARG
jgi:hypothetical protein